MDMCNVTEESWSEDGSVRLFSLANTNGMKVKITNFGATIVSVFAPDKEGQFNDVVLGFDDYKDYLAFNQSYYFGCAVGRVTNRVANGKFTVNGKEYSIAKTGKHAEHGGLKGLSGVLWQVVASSGGPSAAVTLSYVSPDGEEGFPGTVAINLTYRLTNDNEIKIEYRATTDADTVLNLTNHSYFNLLGAEQAKGITDHVVTLLADKYVDNDRELIPTVEGTPMDLRQPSPIRTNLESSFGPIAWGMGFDSSWVGRGYAGKAHPEYLIARVWEESNGRCLEVLTTCPVVQFYTGNCLDGPKGKYGTVYSKHYGFCLETQYHSDAPNHQGFPSIVITADKPFVETTTYRFSIRS